MVYKIGVQNKNIGSCAALSFGKEEKNSKKSECENQDRILYNEKKKHPVTTSVKIQTDKLTKAFTKYPKKGMSGSKNANFYEFLTMGMVPYLTGSAMLIGVFNFASMFFETPAAKSASKLGKRMGLGVLFYGIGKTLSKKLIEKPLSLKYGIDLNLPYDKVVNELPEENNKNNLVAHEYHKVFESVDFPRWDLLSDNACFGPEKDSYYVKVGKKMGMKDEDLENDAEQKVKPKIKEKVVKARLYSTLSSYLWAATGVGIAMQEPFKNLTLFKNGMPDLGYKFGKIVSKLKDISKPARDFGSKSIKSISEFSKDFGSKFVQSSKEFVNNKNKNTRIAGRLLLGSAIGLTLLGNFATLRDSKKSDNKQAAASLIDENKEKAVC